MAFLAKLPEWNAIGVEPNQALRDAGWQPGQSPAPQTFNDIWNKTYLALKELQEKAADKAEISEEPLKNHIKAVMPHQFTKGATVYKYGFSINTTLNCVTFIYEEV